MKKKNLMKSLTALVLSVLMVLSLAACGAKPSDGGKDEDKDGYPWPSSSRWIMPRWMRSPMPSPPGWTPSLRSRTSPFATPSPPGRGDQSVLKRLADQAVADQVDAIIPHRHHRRSGVRRGG